MFIGTLALEFRKLVNLKLYWFNSFATNAMYNTNSRVSVDIAFVDLYMYTVKYRRTVVIVNAPIFIEVSMYI